MTQPLQATAGEIPKRAVAMLHTYPKQVSLKDWTRVTLWPLQPQDEERLYEFFCRIPEEDRKLLKEDVVNRAVVANWCRQIDYSRVLPILAEADDKIVADATLHRRKAGWLQHVGEIRLVVDPAYRRKGLGTVLIEELMLQAVAMKLERLFVELIATEIAAVKAFERFGFERVALLPGFARDRTNAPQDLLLLSADISMANQPETSFY
jgi:ribosomal protein S18 acetylase RimI-like enzyme